MRLLPERHFSALSSDRAPGPLHSFAWFFFLLKSIWPLERQLTTRKDSTRDRMVSSPSCVLLSKWAKYQELVEECGGWGWGTFYEPIEVDCREFAGQSLCKVLTRLGVTGAAKKRTIKAASEGAFMAFFLGDGVYCETRNTWWPQATT